MRRLSHTGGIGTGGLQCAYGNDGSVHQNGQTSTHSLSMYSGRVSRQCGYVDELLGVSSWCRSWCSQGVCRCGRSASSFPMNDGHASWEEAAGTQLGLLSRWQDPWASTSPSAAAGGSLVGSSLGQRHLVAVEVGMYQQGTACQEKVQRVHQEAAWSVEGTQQGTGAEASPEASGYT